MELDTKPDIVLDCECNIVSVTVVRDVRRAEPRRAGSKLRVEEDSEDSIGPRQDTEIPGSSYRDINLTILILEIQQSLKD